MHEEFRLWNGRLVPFSQVSVLVFCGLQILDGHIYCRVSSPFQVEYCGKVGGAKLLGGRKSWIWFKSQNVTSETDSLWNIVKICQLKI